MEINMKREEARQKIIDLFVKELEGDNSERIEDEFADIASEYAALGSVSSINTMKQEAKKIFEEKNKKSDIRDRIDNA